MLSRRKIMYYIYDKTWKKTRDNKLIKYLYRAILLRCRGHIEVRLDVQRV